MNLHLIPISKSVFQSQ